VTRTYTLSLLEVSPAVHAEIAQKLREAGYNHAFHDDDEHGTVIDMHGIALVRDPRQKEGG
jgi:hypothetical protein